MATPLTISIPHQLSRDEARRRIESGFANVVQRMPGAGAYSESWDGNRLTFDVGAMGQSIKGVIDVLDDAVAMQIELPGFLGAIAGGLKEQLQKAGQRLLTKD